jgi:hypothetical protein
MKKKTIGLLFVTQVFIFISFANSIPNENFKKEASKLAKDKNYITLLSLMMKHYTSDRLSSFNKIIRDKNVKNLSTEDKQLALKALDFTSLETFKEYKSEVKNLSKDLILRYPTLSSEKRTALAKEALTIAVKNKTLKFQKTVSIHPTCDDYYVLMLIFCEQFTDDFDEFCECMDYADTAWIACSIQNG